MKFFSLLILNLILPIIVSTMTRFTEQDIILMNSYMVCLDDLRCSLSHFTNNQINVVKLFIETYSDKQLLSKHKAYRDFYRKHVADNCIYDLKKYGIEAVSHHTVFKNAWQNYHSAIVEKITAPKCNL